MNKESHSLFVNIHSPSTAASVSLSLGSISRKAASPSAMQRSLTGLLHLCLFPPWLFMGAPQLLPAPVWLLGQISTSSMWSGAVSCLSKTCCVGHVTHKSKYVHQPCTESVSLTWLETNEFGFERNFYVKQKDHVMEQHIHQFSV